MSKQRRQMILARVARCADRGDAVTVNAGTFKEGEVITTREGEFNVHMIPGGSSTVEHVCFTLRGQRGDKLEAARAAVLSAVHDTLSILSNLTHGAPPETSLQGRSWHALRGAFDDREILSFWHERYFVHVDAETDKIWFTAWEPAN